MLDIMFDLPDQSPGTRYVITGDIVRGHNRLFDDVEEPKTKSA